MAKHSYEMIFNRIGRLMPPWNETLEFALHFSFFLVLCNSNCNIAWLHYENNLIECYQYFQASWIIHQFCNAIDVKYIEVLYGNNSKSEQLVLQYSIVVMKTNIQLKRTKREKLKAFYEIKWYGNAQILVSQ